MIIKTTINIMIDYLEFLEAAVLITGQSRHSIISMIMIRLAEDHDMLPRHWKRVHYQARGNRGRYRRLHISLTEPEYELFLDLKKFCKQSVSRLLACAIDLYLDELVSNLKNIAYNYLPIKYLMEKTIVDGSICWFIRWGVPVKQLHFASCIT
jgi:hypothetical protein